MSEEKEKEKTEDLREEDIKLTGNPKKDAQRIAEVLKNDFEFEIDESEIERILENSDIYYQPFEESKSKKRKIKRQFWQIIAKILSELIK